MCDSRTTQLFVPSAGTFLRSVAIAHSLLRIKHLCRASQANSFLDSLDQQDPEGTDHHRGFLQDTTGSISPVLEVADSPDENSSEEHIEVIKNEPIETVASDMNCSGDNFHRLFRPNFGDITQLAVTSYQVRRPLLSSIINGSTSTNILEHQHPTLKNPHANVASARTKLPDFTMG